MLNINERRLLKNMETSSSIGATSNNGLHRLTLTKTDQKMRDTYIDLLKRAKLDVRVDDFGNIYARRKGRKNDAPAIAFGSHLDTQPYGGRFDGVLGVIAGLEVMEALNDYQIETEYPLELINFTNEEGARFTPPLLGSGAVTNQFDKNYVYGLQDADGITFEKALEQINYKGEEKNRLNNIKNYVELHIEQGPILDNENKEIGIVQGLQGLTRLNVNITGVTNHAGGARMVDRQDALLIASHMIIECNRITNDIPDLRITVGKINNYPNVINVIPGNCDFVVDIRHPHDSERVRSVNILRTKLQDIADLNNVTCNMEIDWSYDMVPFDEKMQKIIQKSADKFGYSSMRLFGGPGHDAKYMSTYTPSAMIFVKSVDGVSHNENELTKDADLIKGANVLLNTIYQLSN